MSDYHEGLEEGIKIGMAEAADEIEKLRAALREIVSQSCETFCISPEGGANILVEGHDRFAFEADINALLSIARAALGEKEAVG
jgi:hypothetical protein